MQKEMKRLGRPPIHPPGTIYHRLPLGIYYSQKASAKRRGIPFLLTFEEWWKVWQDSGHWLERGKGRGKYCMARYFDRGPYKVHNVRIIRFEDNVWEGQHGRLRPPMSEETKRKLSAAKMGKKMSPEARRKMSQSQLARYERLRNETWKGKPRSLQHVLKTRIAREHGR